MKRAADTRWNQFGGLDIWVNYAGIYPNAPFMGYP